MNIILPGESGISKYDEDPNSPLYTEDKDIVMTKDEKKRWMAGDDVPVIQATNPWSMQVDDTNVDKDFYKQTLEMPQQPADQILTLGKADFNQNINNVASILRDILAGDQKAMERPEFQALNFPAIKAYLEWAIKTNTLADAAKGDLMNNAWRLNFKCRPPTPNEFLQEKFIGAQAEALHKPLIDIFCEFFDPLKPYRTLVLTQCIGWGKAEPYSAKVGVGYEDVIDFAFDDGEVLTFNEDNYVFDGLNFIQAKNVKVNLPQSTNLIIMSIYDCRNVKAFEKAFGIDTYDELISFFKNIEIDKEIRTHIHHIIPRSEGGSDDKENLVKLPIYFHIKAHYLRAVECEKSGNKSFAYKNYKAVCCALNKNKIPDNYKDFLKELDICIESLQKRQYYEKKTKWMSKDGKSVRVFEDDFDEYVKNGFTFERHFHNPSTRRWVNKDGKNVYVEKDLVERYLNDGYSLGMYKTEKMIKQNHSTSGTSGMIWIMKDGVRKNVKKEDADSFIQEGWVIGRDFKPALGAKHPHKKQGMHWYTDGKVNIQAVICPEGFKPGRTVCK